MRVCFCLNACSLGPISQCEVCEAHNNPNITFLCHSIQVWWWWWMGLVTNQDASGTKQFDRLKAKYLLNDMICSKLHCKSKTRKNSVTQTSPYTALRTTLALNIMNSSKPCFIFTLTIVTSWFMSCHIFFKKLRVVPVVRLLAELPLPGTYFSYA